jgi:DNA-binding transcriptional ArsR family regulator
VSYNQLADILKALGHQDRIRIMIALSDGELRSQELMDQLGLNQANLSNNLIILRERGLVRSFRHGASSVSELTDLGKKIIRHLFEMKELYG